ncbi:MAG: low specificity L-threonine aldolase, partial [Okeania sp. SIO3B3]|nr:low specificity L-threonine aldolase [Okeania sp. SIO3B3]
LKNASNANQMATKLAQGLVNCPVARLCHPVEANEIFVEIPESVVTGLRADGFQFYVWQEGTFPIIRLVTTFNTRDEDVDAFLTSVRSHSIVNVVE